jgi:hypothetical protein
LVDGITVMADQHRAATDAVQRMGLHSRDTAERVVACMTELQFNDTACQRIEHVRTAMTIVTDLARSGDEQQIDALVGAVCRLQALHLTRTAVEYRERVEALAVHLREIAKDANKICAEAEAATSVETHQGGDAGQDSFIGSIKRNMMVGAELLNRQKSGQESVEVAVRSVSTGFAEMAIDLDAIQSIDSDMRVMGLNATFKCSRLGNQGRALGVIATELRSCSKRTEDCSGQISELLKNAIAMSRALEDREDAGDAATVSELIDWMTNSSIDLGAIIVWLDETLARLSRDSQRAASLLQETADRIVVHHRMNEALTAAAAKLESVADMTGIDGNDIVIMGERIRALLAGHYTMQSERLIHQIFADCFSGEPAVASIAAPAAADATIDDLLF